MRKSGWEESTKGPDWIDCESLMRAIGAVHGGHVALIVSPAGTGSTGGVTVVASAIFDVLPESSLPETISIVKDWPCASHKTLAAHGFSLLHELDFAISKAYKNGQLWK